MTREVRDIVPETGSLAEVVGPYWLDPHPFGPPRKKATFGDAAAQELLS